ncbi:MAG: Gfo/Idh/MocA family protein [Pirellulaceae bacterium]
MRRSLSRRQFVQSAAAAGAVSAVAPMFVPSRVWGANERLNIGVIGVGGRGAGDLAAVATENIAALCDVDEQRLDAAAQKFASARKYTDYRQMIEQKDLEAVVVATPDHHHAPAAMRALRRGLHVYCEKPLTHTVAEARLLAQTAAQMKVATQMGTQNHEHPGYLRLVELLQSGAIGAVREVHVITDRPGRFWQQGLDVPSDTPAVPSHLKWDLWLGPAADRNYHSAYVPFKWRGWWDFGCGAIGDMAIHLMDPAFWALELGGPVQVTSKGPPPHEASGPKWMETRFQFGSRGKLPPVDVYWYEGEAKPPASVAAELPMNGSLFIGDKGRIAIAHGESPKLLPEQDFAGYQGPASYLPKSPGHHEQWIAACKTGSRTGSNFQYAGPFTEIVLLGNVAYRVGETIEYDPAQMKITNVPAANALLSKTYRPGWELT